MKNLFKILQTSLSQDKSYIAKLEEEIQISANDIELMGQSVTKMQRHNQSLLHRVKELETINEEHRILNGNLREDLEKALSSSRKRK